jgi:hypothetical protein
MIEGATKFAADVVVTLRDHPFAIVILLLNIMFIGASVFTMRSIGAAGERRDALMLQMAKDCIVAPKER